MSEDPNILRVLLLKLFPENGDLRTFLQNYPYSRIETLLDALPGIDVPRDDYFPPAVRQILSHGIGGADFFERLAERFPNQKEIINDTQKNFHAGNAPAEMADIPGSRALLRYLLPFEDGDELVGRRLEIQNIQTIVASSGFHFGVVWGRSGCGKTSLLRAGLLPALRKDGYEPVYLERPTDELLDDLRTKIESWHSATEPKAVPEPIVVVVDQLEEFFLRKSDKAEHKKLAGLINSTIEAPARKVSVVVGIREDFFGKLHHLEMPTVPDPTRPANCYELEELPAEVAEEILNKSITVDGTKFGEDLVKQIVADLAVDGMVRPAELQVVASTLKQRRIRQSNGYTAIGGARGLLASYIKDEIAECPDKQMAALVLRRLCAEGRPVKSPVDISEDELADSVARAGLDAGSGRRTLMLTLSRLIDARLVVRTGTTLYNLVHDYIAPLVLLATAGIETETEKANRLLLKYVAEYKDDAKFRIPRYHIRLIRSHADESRRADPVARKLIALSVRAANARLVAATATVAVLLIVVAYMFLSEYLSTQPASFADGRPAIVVRAGHPYLKFLPLLNNVIVDTGYSMLDVSQDAADSIQRETLARLRWPNVKGYSRWADDLVQRLAMPERTIASRLLGEPDQALTTARDDILKGNTRLAYSLGLLSATAKEKQASEILSQLKDKSAKTTVSAEKIGTAAAVGLLEQSHGDPALLESVYRPSFDAYVEVATRVDNDDSANLSWQLRNFQLAPAALVLAAPSLASAQDTQALLDLRLAPKADAFRKSAVLDFLQAMALANPEREETVARGLLKAVVTDAAQPSDRMLPWLTADTIRPLAALAKADPKIVTAEMLAPLAGLIASKPDRGLVTTYALLAGLNPSVATPDAVASIQSCALGKDDIFAANCNLALVRLDSSLAKDLLPKLASSTYDEIKHTAEYMALTSHVKAFSDTDRRQFLQKYLTNECRGSTDDILDNSDGYGRLYSIASANMNIVTKQSIDALLDLIQTCKWSGSKQYGAALLLAAAQFQADYVTMNKDVFNKIQGDEFGALPGEVSAQIHELLIAALARADYTLKKAKGEISLDGIQAQLETRDSAEQRTYGVYASYLYWLDRPPERVAMETLLRALADRPEAELRMAARQALEMIWVGRLTLTEGFPNPPGLARARLTMFEEFPESHIVGAARISLEKWIDAQRSGRYQN